MIHILTSCYVGRLQLTASPRRAWCPGTTFWNINISTLLPARSDDGTASPCQFSPGKFVIILWGARGIMQESNSLFWVLWPSASLALQRGPALLALNRGTLQELRLGLSSIQNSAGINSTQTWERDSQISTKTLSLKQSFVRYGGVFWRFEWWCIYLPHLLDILTSWDFLYKLSFPFKNEGGE